VEVLSFGRRDIACPELDAGRVRCQQLSDHLCHRQPYLSDSTDEGKAFVLEKFLAGTKQQYEAALTT
jgi:hypothetical protein